MFGIKEVLMFANQYISARARLKIGTGDGRLAHTGDRPPVRAQSEPQGYHAGQA